MKQRLKTMKMTDPRNQPVLGRMSGISTPPRTPPNIPQKRFEESKVVLSRMLVVIVVGMAYIGASRAV